VGGKKAVAPKDIRTSLNRGSEKKKGLPGGHIHSALTLRRVEFGSRKVHRPGKPGRET